MEQVVHKPFTYVTHGSRSTGRGDLTSIQEAGLTQLFSVWLNMVPPRAWMSRAFVVSPTPANHRVVPGDSPGDSCHPPWGPGWSQVSLFFSTTLVPSFMPDPGGNTNNLFAWWTWCSMWKARLLGLLSLETAYHTVCFCLFYKTKSTQTDGVGIYLPRRKKMSM